MQTSVPGSRIRIEAQPTGTAVHFPQSGLPTMDAKAMAATRAMRELLGQFAPRTREAILLNLCAAEIS